MSLTQNVQRNTRGDVHLIVTGTAHVRPIPIAFDTLNRQNRLDAIVRYFLLFVVTTIETNTRVKDNN